MEVKKVSFSYRFFKRFFDIILSFLGIILLSWLFIIIALCVLIFSGCPILYHDKRVGKNGKMFSVLKFRSMKRNANAKIETYLTPEELEAWKKERKVAKDPRVTKIGRFLRKTSLDELPQFFNILVGQMSIIGPRPITSNELKEHFTEEEQKILLSTRPGLFSNWSVNGRNSVNFTTGVRQRLELEYFSKRSFFFDTKLFFKVIPVVVSTKGAK